MACCMSGNVAIYTTSFKEVLGESGLVTTEIPASSKKKVSSYNVLTIWAQRCT